jgi:hypothetical protein
MTKTEAVPPWRIACFEGIPGSGKSTAAQRVALGLSAIGKTARWYYEGERQHPLPGFFEPVEGGSPMTFMASTIRHWQAFIANPPPGLHILESHLFQGPIGSLLLHAVEPQVICRFVADLMRILLPLSPRLVFFQELHIAAAIERINTIRWGSVAVCPYVQRLDRSPFARNRMLQGRSGLLTFYQEWAAIVDSVIAGSDWPVTTITSDSSAGIDYQDRDLRINSFLDISRQRCDSALSLESYEGTYGCDAQDAHHFTITSENNVLLVRGCPRLWRDGNRLLPQSAEVFIAESWPLNAIFECGPDGKVRSMQLVDPHHRDSTVGTIYRRLR